MPNAPDDYTITATESTTGKHLTAGAAVTSTFSIQYTGNAVQAGGGPVRLKSAATSTLPTDWDGAWSLDIGDGFVNTTIAELWPGSTNTYLHIIGPTGATVSFASA